VEAILAILAENAAAARRSLGEAVRRVEPGRRCGCRDAMRFSIISDRAAAPPGARARLEPIAGRYL
jgi:5'-methylthioadenosine phosphorylase